MAEVKSNANVGRRRVNQRVKVDQPFKVLFRTLGFVFKRYALEYCIVLICIVIAMYAGIQGTMFTKRLIDDYIMPLLSQQTPDYGPLWTAILRVACFYGAGILASWLQQILLIRISQGSLKDMRNDLFAHMQKLPISYFDQHKHGEIMSVYTNDIDTMRQLISQSIPAMIQGIVQIAMIFFNMIILSPIMTAASIIMVLVIFLVSKKLTSLSGRYYKDQQKHVGELDAYIEEMINGQKVVKTFTREERSLSDFKEINDRLFTSSYNANHFSSILGPINNQLSRVSYVICACLGGYLAINKVGSFSVGSLASYLTFNRQFAMQVNQVSSQVNSILLGLAGASRVYALLDAEVEVDEGRVTLVNAQIDGAGIRECENACNAWAWKDGSSYKQLKGDVVFDKVDFAYVEGAQILYDIDIYARPGQKIAFVGSTGAGKTTITNLINRFYDIQDGVIKYDGIDIKDIKKDDLRHSLGIVLQDTKLFSTSVKENIRYGKLDATDEEVYQAAKLANVDSFVKHLPNGYDTILEGGGQSLSQGQRQLIAIARAAIANPPVLILDEATSSIDTHTEALVQEGMDKLMEGRTSFVIAHRLSTVRNADCIMVLENGHIIERGSHEELIAKQGRYYQLYTGSSTN